MHDMFSSSHLYFDIMDMMLYWMRIVINLQIESQLAHTQTHTHVWIVGRLVFNSNQTLQPGCWYMIHDTHSGEKSDFTTWPRPCLTPAACLLSHWKWIWWVMFPLFDVFKSEYLVLIFGWSSLLFFFISIPPCSCFLKKVNTLFWFSTAVQAFLFLFRGV